MSVALCLFGAWASPALAVAPTPIVSANHIVDSTTGDRFIPRGVNWPSFEYACQQGWGYSNDGADSATVSAMVDWKINTVRIPLNQDCWLGDDNLPTTDLAHQLLGDNFGYIGYQMAVADFVEKLNAQGIVAILDLHWTGPDGVKADGLRSMADSRSDDFWTSVATTFKDNKSVIFDLFNEPHSRDFNFATNKFDFNLTWAQWKSGGLNAPIENDTIPKSAESGTTFRTIGMEQMVAAVRASGASQPIILGGREYANDLTGWLDHKPIDDQLIAGFHNYAGQHCAKITCWQTEISPVAGVVPVLTGEIGQIDPDVNNDGVCDPIDMTSSHLGKFITWANTQNIGYLAWAWWVSGVPCEQNWDLISDLDGTPKAPVGTYFRSRLIEAATTPTPPDPDYPDPEKKPTGPGKVDSKRGKAKLRILKPGMRKGTFTFKVRSVSAATGKVEVKVYVASNQGVTRSKSSSARLRLGSASFSFSIRGDFRPTKIVASYPGDQKLKADLVIRRLGS